MAILTGCMSDWGRICHPPILGEEIGSVVGSAVRCQQHLKPRRR